MKDIETKEDIESLMVRFYSKALADETIGHYFTKVVPLDMEKHIPLITDFWESVLFEKGGYHGNVMQVHEKIHQLDAFRDEHFNRWVSLFTATIAEMYEGDAAEKLKQRATSIATVMKIKTIYGGIGMRKNT